MRIDRIQIVTAEPEACARRFERLALAAPLRRDRLAELGARRLVLALGESEVEVLEPDGAGAAADFLRATGGGLFAAGIAVAEVGATRERLERAGVRGVAAGDQLLVSPEALGIPGLRLVVSPARPRPRTGLVRFLYEVTHLCDDFVGAGARFATLFGIDPGHFVPIRSETFGYEGTLTLFDPDRLDRIEIVNPYDRTKTMGRFFTKRGASLYMAYAESDETRRLRDAVAAEAPGNWTGPVEGDSPDNLFLHPRALGAVMLGVSRTSFAWSWSGRPDRVQPTARPGV